MAVSNDFGRFVDVPGGYLYYETRGAGPDVVLLNAGAADVRMWDTTVAWLAESYRVTTMDYRDTGLSSVGESPYSEIEDIAAVLSAGSVSSATIVGCSDGGRRALAFAHRYPHLVRSVAVVGGTFGDFPDPSSEETAARQEMRDHFARREHARAHGGPAAAAAVDIDAWGSALNVSDRRKMIGYQLANWHFATLEEYLGGELDPPVKVRFAEIRTPVTVLVGDRDFESTALWARRIVAQAPNAALQWIPDGDHFPMFSQPAQFEASLRRVIDAPGFRRD